MPIVTLKMIMEQLNLPSETVAQDFDLLPRKIAAAQDHIEGLLGYKIEVRYVDPALIPPSLVEAVCQLAAWWYETREAASDVAGREVPFGVREIVHEYRDWSF